MCRPKDLDDAKDHRQEEVHDEIDTESEYDDSVDEDDESDDVAIDEDEYINQWRNVLELHRRGETERALDLILRLLRQNRVQSIRRAMRIRMLRAQRNTRS